MLEGTKKVKTIVNFDKDIVFIFHTKGEPDELDNTIRENCLDMRLYFIYGCTTDNYISLRFEDDDLKALYTYLQTITYELPRNSPEV